MVTVLLATSVWIRRWRPRAAWASTILFRAMPINQVGRLGPLGSVAVAALPGGDEHLLEHVLGLGDITEGAERDGVDEG